jgi:DNA recombination protein RmuC
MSEPLFIIGVITLFLLLGVSLLLWLLIRRVTLISSDNPGQLKNEMMLLLKTQDERFMQGLMDSRKELREVSADNRKEINEAFLNLQNTFLKRITENSSVQLTQLNSFKTSLNDISEKLVNNANELKQHVASSFLASSEALTKKQDQFTEKTLQKLNTFDTSIKQDAKDNRKELKEGLNSFEGKFATGINHFNEQLGLKFNELNKQQSEVKTAIEKQLREIRQDNTLQLTEMRKTVDEKLQTTLDKRLGESFKQVSERLEQVHKGLGEMQNLAVGVGDLKKVLANVKTRGILGEYQLGNILEQILAPEQYATNVATKKGSQANVEYAVKLPGKADEKPVWLPIDSKFPLESYQILLQAVEEADPAKIDVAQKVLLKTIESFAREISKKYIDPPHTTDFAIMFLPVESLYAEVLRHPATFELLQHKYHITITGPTTLSALLNSLHMGFRTLAVQKRSSEVWKVLAEVKTEFAKYSEQLLLVNKQLTTASTSLEKLQNTRTNAMEKKLRNVESLEGPEGTAPVSLLKQ